MIRMILNGKKAHLEEIRMAVELLRAESFNIEVRVTWEYGDAQRFVAEASREGVQRIVAAGGDGTLNEVVNGLAKLEKEKRPQLAILPLGTANDFATACAIPVYPLEALRLALEGESHPVDIVKANEKYFINVASGGFGAEVSAETPVQLKNFLGGGAYTLSAVLKALNYSHREGKLLAEGIELEGSALIAVVCNGSQALGGHVLAPNAYIDDWLLDLLVIISFTLYDIAQVVQEVIDTESDGKYVKRFRSRWVESWPKSTRSVNLDGEPYLNEHIRFEIVPQAIQLVLPKNCPCIFQKDSDV